MTFGVHAGQQNVSLEELRRLRRFADRSGFDWISGWDHFQESPPKDRNGACFESVSTMALLAADTQHVRVGCLVFCINYRWVGGLGEKRTLRAAAKYADGWNAPYISAKEFQRKCRILDDWCQQEKRDPAAILRTVNVGFYMGADEAAARGGAELERRRGFLIGTPRQAVDQVAAYEKAGAARLNIALRAPYDWEAVQAFVEEVLPTFGVNPPNPSHSEGQE